MTLLAIPGVKFAQGRLRMLPRYFVQTRAYLLGLHNLLVGSVRVGSLLLDSDDVLI